MFKKDCTEGEKGLEKDYQTYFNKIPRSIPLECLSSDISLGYFIDITKDNSINKFIDDILSLNDRSTEPLLSVLNDRIEVEEEGGDNLNKNNKKMK